MIPFKVADCAGIQLLALSLKVISCEAARDWTMASVCDSYWILDVFLSEFLHNGFSQFGSC